MTLASLPAFFLALAMASPASGLMPAAPWEDGPARFTVDPDSRDVVHVKSWKMRFGDDSAWALPQSADADWEVGDDLGAFWVLHGMPDKGIAWYRARIRITSPVDSLNPLAMHIIHFPTAQEFYWDGVLVAVNGRVGSKAAEEWPGGIFQALALPHRLTGPGEHLLAVRVSNHWNVTGGMGEVKLGAWKPLRNAFHGQWALLLFQVGIIGITGVYFFANFRARVTRTYALFSLICLGCVLQTFLRYLALYSGLDFIDNRWYHAVQYLGYMLMMGATPLCFLSEFSSLPRKWYWVVVASTLLIILPCEAFIFDLFPSSMLLFVKISNDVIGFAAIGTCLGVTGWAAYRRKENSLWASVGLLCMLAGVIAGAIFELTFTWPMGLTALVVFLNAGLTRGLTRQSLAYQETNLKAARLEIELLKNNIQPHFLLTSLRSITDWLEKEPKTAARLVNALAAELRMTLKMTTERMVGLGEEVALCRTHLEVMDLRRNRKSSMEIRGMDGRETLPPMVLHTLLEMGLEEAEESGEGIRFLLERLPGNGLILRLSHGARRRPQWQRDQDGTGLDYVRARLQECFPGRWALHSEPPDGGWSVEIRITDPAALDFRAGPAAPSKRAT